MPVSEDQKQETRSFVSSQELPQDSKQAIIAQCCPSETGSAGRAAEYHNIRVQQKRPWEYAMPRKIGMKRIPLK